MNLYSKIIILLCVVSIFHLTTFARDIYVNNLTGHNTNFGYEPSNLIHRGGPVKTISFALRLASQGDRIILAHNPGHPYRETISLFGNRHSGDFEVPFTIEGNGAVLDGSLPISPDQWTYVEKNVFRMKPSNTTFFVLFLDGKPLPHVADSEHSSALPDLKPLQWCIFDQFVYFAVDKRKQLAEYNLSCTEKMTGITLTYVNRVQINDLAVQGYQIDGISAHNTVDNLVLDNVSLRGNGRYGLMAGKFSRIHLGFSRIGDNASAQLLIDEQAEVTSFLSAFFDGLSPKVINLGGNLTERQGLDSPEIAVFQQLWDPIVVVSDSEEEQEVDTSQQNENAKEFISGDDIQMNDPETSESEESKTHFEDFEEPTVEIQPESDDPFAF